MALPRAIESEIQATIEDWGANGTVHRVWQGDASLWTGADEARWLGWLWTAEDQLAHLERFDALAHDVQEAGFSQVLLLGMGGSSLFPEVLGRTFGRQERFPRLHVLDSTDP